MTFLITKTEADPVHLYLVQDKSLEEVLLLLRTEGLFSQARSQLFELRPSSVQETNGMKLITLHEIGSGANISAAELYLRQALRYARINGHQNEVEVLKRFAQVILENIKDAQQRQERSQGEAANAVPEAKS